MRRMVMALVTVAVIGGGGYAFAGGKADTAERPLLTLALQRRDELGLSAEQVKAIEQARSLFEKEAIRRGADIEIAEREVAELLAVPAVDIAKVEAKVREAARLRADLRLARIKTLEQGKAILMMGGGTGGMMGGRPHPGMPRGMKDGPQPEHGSRERGRE